MKPSHFDLALYRAQDLFCDLVRERGKAHNHGIAFNGTHSRRRRLNGGRARDLARELSNAVEIALDLSRVLDSDLDRARACDLASELDNALNIVIESDKLSDYSSALDGFCLEARSIAALLKEVLDPEADHRSSPGQHRALGIADRLLAGAARMLPARDHARYLEEFRSELAEVAVQSGSRRHQLVYAMRQTWAIWKLRAELRAPHRRGATS